MGSNPTSSYTQPIQSSYGTITYGTQSYQPYTSKNYTSSYGNPSISYQNQSSPVGRTNYQQTNTYNTSDKRWVA